MINKHLNTAQTVLYTLNNRLERSKNLLNWTHPQKTKLVFNLVVFLFVLFSVIPSRFFVLMVVLFFFTEHFRPMGTMGARCVVYRWKGGGGCLRVDWDGGFDILD